MNTFFPAPKTKAEANETIAGLRRLADGWWAMSKQRGSKKAACKRSFRAAEAEIAAIREVLPSLPESA